MNSMRDILGIEEIPTDQQMIDWLVQRGSLLDVSFRPQGKARPVWEILYTDLNGKPFLSSATLFHTAVCWAVRGSAGDD